jgi:signal transduction histidine kinase
MLGYAEMLRDDEQEAAYREHLLDRIDAAGRELLGLIESTLEVGRLDTGRSPMRIETVALPAFWTALRERCAPLPHAPTVCLEWTSEVPEVTLVTDPHKLATVMYNLIGNALKFTADGTVRPRAQLDGEHLVLSVTDTGSGIRPEDHEAIFEVFRQGDGSDTRQHGGTGLGLYIVKRFVQQLGGTVELNSVPGSGSTFIVRLPCIMAESRAGDVAELHAA